MVRGKTEVPHKLGQERTDLERRKSSVELKVGENAYTRTVFSTGEFILLFCQVFESE